MHWQFTTSVLLYLVSGLVTLVTAWMAWQQQTLRGIRSLAAAMLFTALWGLTSALEVAAVETSVKLIFVSFEYAEASCFVLLLFFFVCEYHGLDGWLTPARRLLLWLPGILLTALTLTNPWHHLIWTGFLPGPPGSNLLIYLHGPGYDLCVAGEFLMVLVTIGILAREAIRTRGRRRWRATLMTLSLIAPLTVTVLYATLPFTQVIVDLLPVGFAFAGFLISVTVFGDVAQQVQERTAELHLTINNLKAEVAARERAEEGLRRSEEARRGLEVDRLRSELLANVSHELRTPLGLILLTSTLLIEHDDRMDHDTRVGFLQDIEAEATRLRELVDNLLDLTRLRSGRVRLNCHPTDLARLARDAVTRLAVPLGNHPVITEFPPEPLLATVDGSRIEQVLRNLLVNAANYSPPGAAITVHGTRRANDVLTGVSDRGIGIAAADLEPIFDRFYRVRNAYTQQVSGAGLGLAICRSLVEAHGGRIWAESQVGAGSTFFFTVPVETMGEGR